MISPRRPFDLKLEQNFLSDTLYGGKRPVDELAEIVQPQHFYDPLHQKIWDAALRCAEHSMPMTQTALAATLAAADDMTEGEARTYLLGLKEEALRLDAFDYARHIRDLALRRDLMDAAEDMLADAAVHDPARTAADRLEAAEARLFDLAEDRGGRPDQWSLAQAFDTADALNERARQAPDGVSGVPTGLIDLDRRLGGLQPGELYVLAGRPGMGKTAFALTVAINAARKGRKVRFVSLEMGKGPLAQRYYARQTGISIQNQRRPLSEEQRRQLAAARERLGALPISIDDGDGQTVAGIRLRARRQQRRGGIDLLVVDYLGLIRPTDPKVPKVYQIEEVTTGLKRLSRELDIPVVLLSQLNRGVEQRDDKRPTLADLRDSGAIEQDADVVLLLYREEYYLNRDEPSDPAKFEVWSERMDKARNRADVIVAKFRQGEIGTVPVHFDGVRQRFGNLSEER